MKTASLGLLEVMVVRVNAGGDAPPDPPSVCDQIWRALNSRNDNLAGAQFPKNDNLAGLNSLNFYSRHVEFLRCPSYE